MNLIAVIPARMKASRFPNKPLAPILGLPMLGHCYFRTSLALGTENTFVATCDQEIVDYISSIGGHAVMTADTHTRATTRSAEAVENLIRSGRPTPDVVLMVQGDEPSVHPEDLRNIRRNFEDPEVEIANLMYACATREEFEDFNSVKVVVNSRSNALYFSREPIPSPWKGCEHYPKRIQTGIIAFRYATIQWFNAQPESPLEQIESVDMNRVLEAGRQIRMVETKYPMVGVDVPEEIPEAEALLRNDPILPQYHRIPAP